MGLPGGVCGCTAVASIKESSSHLLRMEGDQIKVESHYSLAGV